MGIKNWTVVTKSITGGSSGIAAYGRYLEDSNHRNHRGKTEAITPVIGDWRQLTSEQAQRASIRTAEAQARGRGGRPVETLAQSFVVSLPAELRPTPKQWREITRDVVRAIQARLPADQVITGSGDLFVNAHENTKNPHLNIVIGKLAKSGEIRKRVTQKGVLSAVKHAVNAAVVRELGIDHSTYEPKRKNLGKKPKWAYEKLLAEKSLDDIKDKIRKSELELEELTESIFLTRQDIKITKQISEILDNERLYLISNYLENKMPREGNLEQELKVAKNYEEQRERNVKKTRGIKFNGPSRP